MPDLSVSSVLEISHASQPRPYNWQSQKPTERQLASFPAHSISLRVSFYQWISFSLTLLNHLENMERTDTDAPSAPFPPFNKWQAGWSIQSPYGQVSMWFGEVMFAALTKYTSIGWAHCYNRIGCPLESLPQIPRTLPFITVLSHFLFTFGLRNLLIQKQISFAQVLPLTLLSLISIPLLCSALTHTHTTRQGEYGVYSTRSAQANTKRKWPGIPISFLRLVYYKSSHLSFCCFCMKVIRYDSANMWLCHVCIWSKHST